MHLVQSIGACLYPSLSSSSPGVAATQTADAYYGLTSGSGASLGPGAGTATLSSTETRPTQVSSGDVTTAFQQLAADLKSLLLQLQAGDARGTAAGDATQATTAGAAQTNDAVDPSGFAEAEHSQGWHGHHGDHRGIGRLEHDLHELITDLLSTSTAETSSGSTDTSSAALGADTAGFGASDVTAAAATGSGSTDIGQTADATVNSGAENTVGRSTLSALSDVVAQDLLHALEAYAPGIKSAVTSH